MYSSVMKTWAKRLLAALFMRSTHNTSFLPASTVPEHIHLASCVSFPQVTESSRICAHFSMACPSNPANQIIL
jgi:hypothetical protein